MRNGIIKFINEILEQNIDSPKGREYMMRKQRSLPKGIIKIGLVLSALFLSK